RLRAAQRYGIGGEARPVDAHAQRDAGAGDGRAEVGRRGKVGAVIRARGARGRGDRGAVGGLDRAGNAQRAGVVVADGARARARNCADGDRLARVGAHLEGRTLEGAVEQVHAVELSLRGDAVDVVHQLLELRVEVGTVARAVRSIQRLNREVTHGLQVVHDLLHGTRGGLGKRHTVVGVLGGLVQAV